MTYNSPVMRTDAYLLNFILGCLALQNNNSHILPDVELYMGQSVVWLA